MFGFIFLCIFLCVESNEAVIYKLNDTQYAQIPPLVRLDPYKGCFVDASALYCTVNFALVSDEPSPLLNMITEYSEHVVTHYNHSRLQYGICVTQTCKQFYNNESLDLKRNLEACLNETLSKMYGLKANILDEFHCNVAEKPKDFDVWDFTVGAFCLLLLLINILGTLNYNSLENHGEAKVSRFLLCFSIQRNWTKLMPLNIEGQEPRLQRLESFDGFRVILTCLVIMSHCFITGVISIKNTKFIEEAYFSAPNDILLNGGLALQMFFIMSSFLLVYYWLLYSEKSRPSWSMLPKQILWRWLRLTPVYAFLMALTASLFAHCSSGPLWGTYIQREMNDCRRYWWQNILYISNYFNNSTCMLHTWYLAADMQLYILAVIVYLACTTARSRKVVLSLLFVAGMIMPAAHVYFQDLDAILMLSPQTVVDLFVSDPHFKYVYTRGHTNIAGYTIGMASGYLVYHWQKQGIDVKNCQNLKYRLIFWSLLPLGLLTVYSGGIFYADEPKLSIYIRTLFAAFIKPVFGLISSAMIIGLFFKCEDVYRKFLEWHGWKVPSRLSYSAYLIHAVFIRSYVVSRSDLPTISYTYFAIAVAVFLAASFAAALIVWLLVEAPFNNIVKEYILKSTKKVEKKIN